MSTKRKNAPIGNPNAFIVVVKKTFRYTNVFFYNDLYHPSVFRNLFLKSGINLNPVVQHPLLALPPGTALVP